MRPIPSETLQLPALSQLFSNQRFLPARRMVFERAGLVHEVSEERRRVRRRVEGQFVGSFALQHFDEFVPRSGKFFVLQKDIRRLGGIRVDEVDRLLQPCDDRLIRDRITPA